MAKFKMGVKPTHPPVPTRLGSAADAAGRMTDTEMWKLLKLAGESRYDLCAAGDPIEGQMVALEAATQDGFSIGSVRTSGKMHATCDGLEATPGTGTIAVGDYVVCGTVVAKGTAISGTIPSPKVCKATNQPGVAIVSTVATADTAAAVKVALDAALVKAASANLNSIFAWRVISLGNAGAVGDSCVIERVNEV